MHRNIARALKANLYLPRLSDHGLIEEEPMLNFTGQKYLDSAKEALAIAKKIGEKVIVISSSTGGTLSLILGNDPQIAALLLFGPNVEIYDPKSKLLTLPWGLQIAEWVLGGKYHNMNNITEKKRITGRSVTAWSPLLNCKNWWNDASRGFSKDYRSCLYGILL